MTNVRPVADRRATCTFSSAVSVAKVAVIWNVRLTPRRQIAYGGRPEIRSPRNATRPASAASWPVRMLKNVVFPAPFGPMSARISPRGSSKETPSTACTPPNVLRTPSTLSTASDTTPLRHDTEEPARTREHQRDQNPAGDERHVVIAQRARQPRSRPDAEEAVVAAGHVVPLVDDRVGDLREGQRQHREIDGRQADAKPAVERGAGGGHDRRGHEG